jgi:hypothetical protein
MDYRATQPPSMYVTSQPIVGNPFQQLNGEWNVGLCQCCDNVSQCETIAKSNYYYYYTNVYLWFVGAYAYFCSCCFVGSLGRKIDEPFSSRCCVPNVLGSYRMKVRSVLRIRVSYSIKQHRKTENLIFIYQGDSCDDYCVTCCMPFCAAIQMTNELESRGIV